MKIKNDGSVNFYRSSFKSLLNAFAGLVVLGLFYIAFNSSDGLNKSDPFIIAITAFMVLYVLYCFYNAFFNNKPYVKLTEHTIEISAYPPILWEDISSIYLETHRVGRGNRKVDFLVINVRDLSFYKVKLSHKLRRLGSATPFSKSLEPLSKADTKLLEREVKARLLADIKNIQDSKVYR